MRILLDTHILLWWLDGDSRLSVRAGAMIADPANTVFVSAVSLWEIRLKQSLGKLDLPSGFEEALGGEDFENLPLTAEHTRELTLLPWHHRDPFDRMLIAQARAARLHFLTADAVAQLYGPHVVAAG